MGVDPKKTFEVAETAWGGILRVAGRPLRHTLERGAWRLLQVGRGGLTKGGLSIVSNG
jgi:hypothetical protein